MKVLLLSDPFGRGHIDATSTSAVSMLAAGLRHLGNEVVVNDGNMRNADEIPYCEDDVQYRDRDSFPEAVINPWKRRRELVESVDVVVLIHDDVGAWRSSLELGYALGRGTPCLMLFSGYMDARAGGMGVFPCRTPDEIYNWFASASGRA